MVEIAGMMIELIGTCHALDGQEKEIEIIIYGIVICWSGGQFRLRLFPSHIQFTFQY